MESGWKQLEDDGKPTPKMRRALYRLGYSRWLVGQLSREQAATFIAQGIEAMGKLKETQRAISTIGSVESLSNG
jgi:hypothetical protein